MNGRIRYRRTFPAVMSETDNNYFYVQKSVKLERFNCVVCGAGCQGALADHIFLHFLVSLPFQIYYGGACLVETNYLDVEREYLAGNVESPLGESFLERERVSSSKCAHRSRSRKRAHITE